MGQHPPHENHSREHWFEIAHLQRKPEINRADFVHHIAKYQGVRPICEPTTLLPTREHVESIITCTLSLHKRSRDLQAFLLPEQCIWGIKHSACWHPITVNSSCNLGVKIVYSVSDTIFLTNNALATTQAPVCQDEIAAPLLCGHITLSCELGRKREPSLSWPVWTTCGNQNVVKNFIGTLPTTGAKIVFKGIASGTVWKHITVIMNWKLAGVTCSTVMCNNYFYSRPEKMF